MMSYDSETGRLAPEDDRPWHKCGSCGEWCVEAEHLLSETERHAQQCEVCSEWICYRCCNDHQWRTYPEGRACPGCQQEIEAEEQQILPMPMEKAS